MEAMPLPSLLADHQRLQELAPEVSAHYYLHDNSTAPYQLSFAPFAGGMPPFPLHFTDIVTVEGIKTDVSHSVAVITVYAIGVYRDEALVNPQPSSYQAVTSDSYKALYVLMDFADAENNCDAIAPSGVSGRDYLKSLLFTGTHHGGRHIKGLYADMSNNRLSLVQEADLDRQIAGPWKFTEFSAGADCNSGYYNWQSAARARAAVCHFLSLFYHISYCGREHFFYSYIIDLNRRLAMISSNTAPSSWCTPSPATATGLVELHSALAVVPLAWGLCLPVPRRT